MEDGGAVYAEKSNRTISEKLVEGDGGGRLPMKAHGYQGDGRML